MTIMSLLAALISHQAKAGFADDVHGFVGSGEDKFRPFLLLAIFHIMLDWLENPDLRTTIYWNPKVITDKVTGKASFDFPNADGRGNYRVVIEGIDIDGNLARSVYRYKVE